MPATAITTDLGTWLYEHPNCVVSISDALREADFVEVANLRCVRARWAVAPEIPHAVLSYQYGRVFAEDGSGVEVREPQDLVGKFVKIKIPATVAGDTDRTWYGRIDVNSRQHHGLGDDGTEPTGEETFTASGVLRLLDLQPILKSFIRYSSTLSTADPLEIPVGLPFESDRNGAFPGRGNRNADLEDSSDYYIFSPQARGASNWDAWSAAKYLLTRLSPLDAGGTPANIWSFFPSTEAGQIDWYDISVQTDGKTVKQVLDELIPRHRGVGYYADFQPSNDTCEIHVFSFAETNLTLPSGGTLKANPDLRSLNFDAAIDVDQCSVNDVNGARYNRIVARGEKRTTTFTHYFGLGDVFTPDWTSEESASYYAGAKDESWYGTLTQDQQMLANAAARASDRLRNVFCRWRARRNELPIIIHPDGLNMAGERRKYYIAPDLTSDPLDSVFTSYTSYTGTKTWSEGMKVLRTLPLQDRYDYSGDKISLGRAAWEATVEGGTQYDGNGGTQVPEFLPPFAFVGLVAAGADPDADLRVVPLHRMHETAFDATLGRKFSVGLEVSSNDCAFRLVASPNHFLNTSDWNATPAAEKGVTAPAHEPSQNGGLNYFGGTTPMGITVCCEIDEHVTSERTLSPPGVGSPESVLVLQVPDARCDWVAPFTVVEIRAGRMTKTTTGGFVRDDRNRVKDIARAAAEWYGRTRQTLSLRYRTVRNLFQLGWLITDFGEFQKTDVNTPITAIDVNFGDGSQPGTTTIETGYAALDFQ